VSSPRKHLWENLLALLDTRDKLTDVLDARAEDVMLVLQNCKDRAEHMKKRVDAAFQQAHVAAKKCNVEIPQEILIRQDQNWPVSLTIITWLYDPELI
jgi:hypothetical protein